MGPIGPISADLPEARLRFAVRDTGIGIPTDKQDKIFLAFEQGDNSITRRFGGTGLGLSIASRLVGLMGGSITVESEVDRGSTFRFLARFGRQPNLLSAPTEPPAVALHGSVDRKAEDNTTNFEPASAQPLKILLAEDNELNQQVVQHFLARRGHAVQVAKDGREALAALEKGSFDLLLLDVHMPELDGFRVVEAVRRREQTTARHLPVVALTARSMKGDRERCLQAGMDDYLSKPVRRDELFATIERVLSGQAPGEPGRGEAVPAHDLLDAATLLTACDGDPGLLGQMIAVFQAGAASHLSCVSEAIVNRNAADLREAAHKLVGLVSAFSTRAAETASSLEQSAASGQLNGAAEHYATLSDMIENLGPLLASLSVEDLKSRLERAGR
jgi:CheY-like chemotaxis protein